MLLSNVVIIRDNWKHYTRTHIFLTYQHFKFVHNNFCLLRKDYDDGNIFFKTGKVKEKFL